MPALLLLVLPKALLTDLDMKAAFLAYMSQICAARALSECNWNAKFLTACKLLPEALSRFNKMLLDMKEMHQLNCDACT